MPKKSLRAGDSEKAPPKSKLNINQQCFCERYVNHGNALVAYREAYPECSYDSARTGGPRLMLNADILDEITLIRQRDAIRINFTRDKALRLLSGIADNPSHKQQRDAINDLWEKLGLGNTEDQRDRKSILDRISSLSSKLRR